MKPKKSYAQHFLTNKFIAKRIADSLQDKEKYSKVLEIGPGKGMLTQFLLENDYKLFVVEADRDMVAFVSENFPELKGRIFQEDFLKMNLKSVFNDEPVALIGNLPYNISSQILFKMLEFRNQVPEMVGMFQKEVAERIIAPPGSKTYGVISVLIQAFYEGQYLFTVNSGSFNPPPKVKSGVIRLVLKKDQNLGCDEKLFKKVVKQAFGQRRKMLRNTMKVFITDKYILSKDIFIKRPEQLSVEDFVRLTNMIN